MPAKRIVKFVGGPLDGLECRDDSADRFEASIAVVWSLFRIGCGGPLTPPESLARREALRLAKAKAPAPQEIEPSNAAAAHYRVIRRTLERGAAITVAWHAPPECGRP